MPIRNYAYQNNAHQNFTHDQFVRGGILIISFFLPIFQTVRRQNAGGQNAGGQNAGQICIGGQNAGQFWGRVDKMPGSSNHISTRPSIIIAYIRQSISLYREKKTELPLLSIHSTYREKRTEQNGFLT